VRGHTLMGHDEYDSGSSLDCLPNIGDSNDILRKLDSRKILFVLVILIDDLRQFPSLKLLVRTRLDQTRNETRRTSSSNTQIFTSSSKRSVCFLALCPAILAIADPLSVSSSSLPEME
jgi:hypothetical protein